jgi:hypothetical protein
VLLNCQPVKWAKLGIERRFQKEWNAQALNACEQYTMVGSDQSIASPSLKSQTNVDHQNVREGRNIKPSLTCLTCTIATTTRTTTTTTTRYQIRDDARSVPWPLSPLPYLLRVQP